MSDKILVRVVPNRKIIAVGKQGPPGPGSAIGTALPQPLGVAAAGVAVNGSHEDHVHPMPTAAQVGAPTGSGTSTGTNTGDQSGASPTASIGLAAINGTAATFMRSDGAPALSQSIAPIWTGIHQFNTTLVIGNGSGTPPADNTPYVFESITDPSNTVTSALRISPRDSAFHRLYFGTAARPFYSLNFSNVANFEGLPTLSTSNGVSFGGDGSQFVFRSSNVMVYGSAYPGFATDDAHAWYTGNSYATLAGQTKVMALTKSGQLTLAGPLVSSNFKGTFVVATLPAGVFNDHAGVTDALAPVAGATVVGGGTVQQPVVYKGGSWKCETV